MFLKFVVTINITIGLVLYMLNFPGPYAPYMFTVMFIIWWLVITDEYKLWKTPASWGWAILPVFAVPVISILLYVIMSIGMLVGVIGVFLIIYVYAFFAWARYYVEGILPFGGHEAELHEQRSEGD